jgi:hypothetical protein
MELYLKQLFGDVTTWALSALLAAMLFFIMAGFRELKENHSEGLLFLVLGLFFFCGHFYCLWNHPFFSEQEAARNVWLWLTSFLAPALIGVFILFGLFSLAVLRFRPGMVKLFFGLTLLCYLSMLGPSWPADVRGILTLIWSGIWFEVEIGTAPA